MKEMLKKLMEKKGTSDMSPEYKNSKKEMLMQLMKEMDGMMAEPMKNMKKVTVASPDKEGLEEGLDKAKEILSDKNEEMPDMEEESEDENEDMSLEEIEDQIKKLEELKKNKMGA